jgi:hypothetical protein
MAKTNITRSEFEALDYEDKARVARDRNYQIVNDEPVALPKASELDPKKSMSRAAFDKLGVFEKHAIIKRGILIVNCAPDA